MNDVNFPADCVQFTVGLRGVYLTSYGNTEVTEQHVANMRDYLDRLEAVKFVKQETRPKAYSPSGTWWDADLVQVDAAYEAQRPGALVVVTGVSEWTVTGFPMVPAWPEGKSARLCYHKQHVSWCGHLKWPATLWTPAFTQR